VAGNIVVYDHRKMFSNPDIITYYNEGDIIGDRYLFILENIKFLKIPKF